MSLPRDVEPLAVPPGSDYGMSHAVETAAAHGPTTPWVALAYLVAGVFFILALRGLSSPATSRAGNRNGMIGMLIAVVTVIVTHDIANIVAILIAIAIGVPVGILVGRFQVLRGVTNIPSQFLRMISPLSWMPIAVMAFATWDGAIVFLIAVAAVWPILFSTAAGLRRVDPSWFKVARNLGARPWHMLFVIILPAISQDILTGIRLALGVAWIVLVPAEYLGVTSGLGYSINDARDTLEYDRLAATVVIIGVIGFLLDFACQQAISKLSWHRED